MPLVVGVQTVVFLVVEKLRLLVHQRIKPREGIEVDDRHAPDVPGLLHRLHIAADIFAALVAVLLARLPVGVAAVELRAVDGREQHDLLRGEHALHLVKRNVYAPAVGGVRHAHVFATAVHEMLLLVDTCHHLLLLFGEPLPHRHSGIEIVSADEDYYSVEVVAVFRFQFLRLPRNIVPLPAAHTVDVRRDAEPLL